ncbi:hypothetical protein ACW7G2_03370 [Luteimonas sp. A277]
MKRLLGLVCLAGVVVTGSVLAQSAAIGERLVVGNKEVVAAGGDARIVAEQASVLYFEDMEPVVSFEDAVLETGTEGVIGIAEGIHFPGSRVIHASGPLFLPATHLVSDIPVDDHDGAIELTCNNGKMYRDGKPTGISSICLTRGVRFTCHETGTGGVIDMDDPTCN